MKKFLSVLLAVCMIFGMISIMPLAAGAAETTGTRTISVGVINYLTDELGTEGYNVHYWGGADEANDALLTRDGTKVEYKILSDEFEGWKGQQQTFYMFTATIPADATGFKVHNGDRWFGEDGTDQDKVYIFNYSGDKALYEKTEVTPEPETTAPTTAPATTAPTEVATDAPIVGGITYYLVGDMTGWDIDPDYALTKNAAAEADEYMISGVTFTAEQGFKVVGYNSSIQDFEAVWYPDGMDNDCVIHDAGTYDIYFRPNYDGGEDWYYGCIYVVAPEAPTEAPTTAPETTAPTTAPETTAPITGTITVYFTNNKGWESVNVHMWKDGGESTKWPGVAATYVGQNDYGEAIFSAAIDTAKYDHVIFNGSNGQTADIAVADAVAGGLGIYCLDTTDDQGHFNVGFYEYTAVEPETTPATEPATTPATEPATEPVVLTDGYYIVGTMTDWAPAAAYKMTKNDAAEVEEYVFEGLALTTESQFKVVKVEGKDQTWYPEGMGNNYGENGEIEAAGTYTVYFRPGYNGGEDWFNSCIYVAAAEEPSTEPATEPATEPSTEPATEPVEHTTAIVDGKYYIDGKLAKGYGLVQFEDEIYFVQRDGSVFTSGKVTVSEDKTNDILPAGTYVFDDEGKLVNSGSIVDGKYYEKGKIVRAAGVVQIKSGFYFVKRDGSVLTGEKITVSETASNGLIPAGTYRAAENGKLDISGIINGYYYKDGKIILGAGVVQFKSGLYFIKRNGTVMTSGKITISETASNGLISPGTYRIDETGKLPTSGVINGYYYKNGTIAKGAGVVEFNGDLYFVKRDGSVFTSGKVTVSEDKSNGLVDAGTYSFDADGKLIAE